LSAPRVWRLGQPVQPLVDLVRRGGILVIPTESSYGLGVDPRSPAGVEAVFAAKRREQRKPLPVVAASLDQLRVIGIDPQAPEVAPFAPLWPAALSVVAPLAAPLPAAAGDSRLAVRVPAHEPLRALLAALGTPLTATSANPSGEPPILAPGADLDRLLDGFDAVLVDGGRLPGGPPSTLVELQAGKLRLHRAGSYPLERLKDHLFSTVAVEIVVENLS